ncbi:response regulator transcription factor [Bacillus sp. REN16]|uniref:response regulator transcription factor n=1 Tax=Bacillus sp. REN16 TaxID=2887296 RepID=UPI001E495C22|nr:response regulator transcription factor [Bacillus sp. REN16]MCC3357053.1 helix-turn-helix transcriptional regulator [Bacillus sp. REN16]
MNMDGPNIQITGVTNKNITKHESIELGHKYREELLHYIRKGEQRYIPQYADEFKEFLRQDTFDIMKRIPRNQLRAYKNILLSHNTLYSYSAEKGGLSAWQSHFLSEKYAIMVENAKSISELEEIHKRMLEEYSDPSIRFTPLEKATIAEKVEHFIRMNFSEEISIEEISQKLHVHPSHLMRAFKKERGMTISHFRNLIRIKEAKDLLTNSNLSLIEITLIVGFKNQQYFTRVFKEAEGVTPKEYKRNNVSEGF